MTFDNSVLWIAPHKTELRILIYLKCIFIKQERRIFIIVDSEKSPIIVRLQFLGDPTVEFSMADPDLLKVTYDLTLTDEENNTLQLEAGDGLKTTLLLSQQEKNDIAEQSGILANFKSPIIINLSKRIAIQKSINSAELPITS